jgi:hypothetical protein
MFKNEGSQMQEVVDRWRSWNVLVSVVLLLGFSALSSTAEFTSFSSQSVAV